jgi:hypothetical protein
VFADMIGEGPEDLAAAGLGDGGESVGGRR